MKMLRPLFLALLVFQVVSASWARPTNSGDVVALDPKEVLQKMGAERERGGLEDQSLSIFEEMVSAIKDNDRPSCEDLVKKLRKAAMPMGVTVFPGLADALVRMAADMPSGSSHVNLALDTALDLDPRNLGVSALRCRVAADDAGRASPNFLLSTGKFIWTSMTSPEVVSIRNSNAAGWLYFASLLWALALSLTWCLRSKSLIFHDIEEFLGGPDNNSWALFFGWVILFLPVLFTLNGPWLIVWWLAIAIPHLPWKGRLIHFLALAFLLGSGFWYRVTLYDMAVSTESSYRAQWEGKNKDLPDGRLEEVKNASQSGPFAKEIYALRLLQAGQPVQAETILTKLLAEDPRNARILSNIGLTYFARKSYDQAINFQSKAILEDSHYWPALWNRRMSYMSKLEFDKAQSDGDLARMYASKQGRHLVEESQIVMWPPSGKFLAETRKGQKGNFAPLSFESPGIGILFWRPWLIVAPFIMAFFLAFGLIKGRRFFSRACLKCGKPFCARCRMGTQTKALPHIESFCNQCTHIFVKRDGVSPEARMRKVYEGDRHRLGFRLQRGVMALLMPGAGHIFEEHYFSGGFFTLLWSLILVGTFWLRHGTSLPTVGTPTPLSWVSALLYFLLAIFWLMWGVLRAFSPVRKAGVKWR